MHIHMCVCVYANHAYMCVLYKNIVMCIHLSHDIDDYKEWGVRIEYISSYKNAGTNAKL